MIQLDNVILDYILKMSICSGSLYLLFRAIESKIRFSAARVLLIVSIVLSITLPLLSIEVFPAKETVVAYSPSSTLHQTITQQPQTTINWIMVTIYCSVVVSVILMSKIIISIRSITKIRRGSKNKIIISKKVKSPFSFLSTIYIPEIDDEEHLKMILAHEREHIRLHHSIDKIFMESVCALFWFNPIFHMTKNSLSEVHEFQADRKVTKIGCDLDKYKMLIFLNTTGYIPGVAGGLNNSITKKRIIMISKNEKRGWRNTLFAIPAIAVLMLLVSFTEQDAKQTKKPKQITEAQMKEITPDNIAKMEVKNGEKEGVIFFTTNDGDLFKTTISNSNDLKVRSRSESVKLNFRESGNSVIIGEVKGLENIDVINVERMKIKKDSDNELIAITTKDGETVEYKMRINGDIDVRQRGKTESITINIHGKEVKEVKEIIKKLGKELGDAVNDIAVSISESLSVDTSINGEVTTITLNSKKK